MKIKLTNTPLLLSKADTLAVGIYQFEKTHPPELFVQLNQATHGMLTRVASFAAFTGSSGQTIELNGLTGTPFKHLVLVGLGKAASVNVRGLRDFAATAVRHAEKAGSGTLETALPGEEEGAPGNVVALRAVVEGLVLADYQFDKYLSKKPRHQRSHPRVDACDVNLRLRGNEVTAKDATVKSAFERAMIVAHSTLFTRDLVNEPPNVLYPETLAKAAKAMAAETGLGCEVWDEKKIQQAGMNLLYAVGKASETPPRFIILRYTPAAGKGGKGAKGKGKGEAAARHPVILGKGLTYDSGGLCIKPPASMMGMKQDMSGAGAVLGAMRAIALLKPPYPVTGLVVAAENAISSNAYRPGDVITGLGGKSVEVNNTDAEGRLCLADGLSYAEKLLKPAPTAIIDIATLTGACMVALGDQTSGLWAANDGLATEILAASKRAGESVWHMPLLDELKGQLKSDIADMQNTGDRFGGAITAALFLKEFAGSMNWAHLDIAGPAFASRERGYIRKGGTGHPVATLVEFIYPTE